MHLPIEKPFLCCPGSCEKIGRSRYLSTAAFSVFCRKGGGEFIRLHSVFKEPIPYSRRQLYEKKAETTNCQCGHDPHSPRNPDHRGNFRRQSARLVLSPWKEIQ